MQSDEQEPVIQLGAGWEFHGGRPPRRWLNGGGTGVPVTLPHTWNATEEFQAGRDCTRGTGAYRVSFELPAEPRAGPWHLRTEGFYGTGRLYVNGRAAGRIDGAYLGLDEDLTAWLRPGLNRVGCVLSNNCGRNVLPGIRDPDFLLYGGLAGRAWLVRLPDLRWDEADVRLAVRDEPDGMVAVTVQARLINDTPATQTTELAWTIAPAADGGPGAAGITTTATCETDAHASRDICLSMRLAHPARWSPATPALHDSVLILRTGDGRAHQCQRRFGIRQARFVPGRGFHLDGTRVFLRGCNRHENLPGFGNALPEAVHRLDAQTVHALGLNFVRLSHYPQSPHFLDACDRLGIFVMPELASWKSVRGGGWLRAAKHQLRRMVLRDRHHPCVILWGLGNESRHRRAYIELDALAKSLDPEQRPSIYAENHIRRARRRHTLGVTDVWGCNYEMEALDAGRAAARLRCTLVTECANVPHAWRGNLAAEQEQAAQVAADVISATQQADGVAVWCFNDYATLRKQRYFRACGVVDGWREPKPAAFWLAAAAQRRPVLQAWVDWGQDGPAARRLSVVANLDDLVRVAPDGSVARLADERPQSVPHLLEATVPFDRAPLRLAGRWQGQSHTWQIEPWGPATDLRLSVAWVDVGPQARCAVVAVQALDASARPVHSYEAAAEVAVEGAGRAALIDGRTVPVAAGRARIVVAQEGPTRPLAVHVRVGALPPRTIRITWCETATADGTLLVGWS